MEPLVLLISNLDYYLYGILDYVIPTWTPIPTSTPFATAVPSPTPDRHVRTGALTVTGGMLVGEGVLSIDGDLALANGLTLDFAGRQDLDLRAGEAVAVVSGAATLPNSAKAVNAGDVKAVTFVRDGTVVYACKIPSGAVLIIR